MAKPRPIRRIHVPLGGKHYLTCVFWRSEAQMQEALDYGSDFRAITVCYRNDEEKHCIARIHFSREALDIGTIAHEVRHAVDHYHDRIHSEHVALMTERCLMAIHEVAEEIG